jgi:hypothetical protein
MLQGARIVLFYSNLYIHGPAQYVVWITTRAADGGISPPYGIPRHLARQSSVHAAKRLKYILSQLNEF